MNTEAYRRAAILRDAGSGRRACSNCGWSLEHGAQRRYVAWKTAGGRKGGPNLVCTDCSWNHAIREAAKRGGNR